MLSIRPGDAKSLLIRRLGALCSSHEEDREDEEYHENHHAERRRVAVSVEVERRLIDITHEDVRLIRRFAAVGHQPHHIEVVECPYHAEDNGRHHHRAKQRHGDVPELAPARCAIDLRGLVERFVDRLEAAERDDHHKRESEPDVCQDARGKSLERRFEPLDRRHREEFRYHQIDRAVLVVEHPAPGEGGYILRHRPRDYQQCAENPLARQRAVEEHRQKHADRYVEKDIDHSPDNRFREDRIKKLLAENLAVLPEPDYFPVGEVAHRHVRQRDDEIVDKGIQHHRHHDKRGGEEHHICEMSVGFFIQFVQPIFYNFPK